jgi:DNA-binding NarL/FixJ family response regulator
MAPTRILIVDDERPIRRGLLLRLRAEPDIDVVGEAPDGLSAIDCARRLKPDLILMDVRMPGLDGLSAAARILADDPGVRVIFLTMHDDARVRAEAARLGAAGVVGKQMIDEELVATIRTVAATTGIERVD